jgi:hypothetical protein
MRVMLLPVLVRLTIEFNDEAALETAEVGDVSINRELPPEFEPSKHSISQASPELFFGRSGFTSHHSSERLYSAVNSVEATLHVLSPESAPHPRPLPRVQGREDGVIA